MTKFYKNTIKLVVLTQDHPLNPDRTLADIDYDISEGDAIGEWQIESSEQITDHERIRQELIAIHNDGTFFDPVIEEDE